MTYLATEMLLYLLSATLIGLVLGWLIWGTGQRRRLNALHGDLTTMIEQEKEAHHRTRLSLGDAEVQGKKALESAKADASRSMAKLNETIDAERLSTQEAKAELDRLRAGMDETIQEGRASVQKTIDQALETANAERATAAQAMAKEAQSRAQIEELRLLIGAEKLAAESARAELEETRRSMGAELETERVAHEQAKTALNDIRSTLARTLGSGDFDLTGDQAGGFDGANGMTGSSSETGVTAAFSMMTDMTAAGEALNNPDLDEADIEDQEGQSLDLPTTIDADPMPADLDEETDDAADPSSATVPGRVRFRASPSEPPKPERPAIFLNQRPEDGDNFLTIDGISPEIERRLHDSGCYYYGQLADLTSADVAWLAEEVGLSSFQIAADRWVEQAKALRSEKDAEGDHALVEEPNDRQNAAG